MTEELKNQNIEDYLNKIAEEYPQLIDDEKLKKAKDMFLNRSESYDEIIEEINKIIKDMIEKENQRIEMRNKLAEEIKKKQTEALNKDKFFGETYKSSLIEIFKLYENINSQNITENEKHSIFEQELDKFISASKIKTAEYIKRLTNNPELREYGLNSLYIGYESLNYDNIGHLRDIFINDFDVIQCESEGKMKMTIPADQRIFDDNGNINPNLQFDFSRIKIIYDYAKEHGKQIKHHELLWHNSVPENLRIELERIDDPSQKRNMTLKFLNYYYEKLAGFLKEYDVRQIDALNEIASDDMTSSNIYRQSFWKDMIGNNPLNGDEYFIDVLRIIRKNFPYTELIYNEYNEFYEEKCDRMCEIIKYIQSREHDDEKLLDGLGLQAHYRDYLPELDRMLTSEDIERTALKFAQLGIPIYITEFDFINTKNSDISKLLETFVNTYGNIASGFNTWGNSDELTWDHCLGTDGKTLNPHIVDANGNKKAIFDALKNKFLKSNDKELDTILSTLSDDSLHSSRELLDKYKTESEFKRIQTQQTQLINIVRELRNANSTLSESDFYKLCLTSFLNPVIQKINEQYGNILPADKLQKINNLLNGNNIVDFRTLSEEEQKRYAISDIQSDSTLGKIIFNPNATTGSTLEEKIVASMGTSIHETFHLMINMQQGVQEENTRFFYKVATTDGVIETHFAPGKYGQVLSEGFVEKTSIDFAKVNGFYYTPNPSYTQYVSLANYIQKTNPSVDSKFLLSHNASEVLKKLDGKQKEKIEATERIVAFNHFPVKEVKSNPELKGVKSTSVIESCSEINDKKDIASKNNGYKEPFKTQKQNSSLSQENTKQKLTSNSKVNDTQSISNKKSFNQRSQSEIQVHEQIKQKNQAIKQQKAQQHQLNKPKVKTLTQSSSNNGGSSSNKGFTNVVILSLIVSFVCGALFMIVYMLIKG